jgi:poly(3-hydroxybutyrate) depolymerase
MSWISNTSFYHRTRTCQTAIMPGPTRFFNLCVVLGLCLLLGQAYAGSSKGCGLALDSKWKKGSTGQSNKINFTTIKGEQRSALLHFPKNYDENKAHGLIFSFHGRSGTPAGQESLTKLSDPQMNKNMLVLYPEGIDKQWQGDPLAKTDDVAFTLDMIDSMLLKFCIDPDSIYASGQSNGGGFTANILACDPVASRRIAAFAGVSGAYYQGTSDANCKPLTVPITCNPGRKHVPILDIHGLKDETIPYNGGARRNRCLPALTHFMTAWAERNGLGEYYAQSNLNDNHVKKLVWGGKQGDLKGLVTHYSIDNMGHTWPSGGKYYVNATPHILEFFGKWTLESTPGARDDSAPISTSGSSSPSKPKPALCPAQNDRNHEAGGKTFRILCGSDTARHPAYTAATYPGSLRGCVAQCAADDKCGHVVMYKDKCWKKSGKPGAIDKTGNASIGQKL